MTKEKHPSTEAQPLQGFGCADAPLRFYIANRPPLDHYPALSHLQPLAPGEVTHIVANTSNHWRKAFNVCAKLLFDWHKRNNHSDLPESWQSYREQWLFQNAKGATLLFSPPDLSANAWHIIFGKTYASSLAIPGLVWHDAFFASLPDLQLIVSPYPDYRQLSNERIQCLLDFLPPGNFPKT